MNEAIIAVVVTLLVGAATFLLGFNDGSYQLTDRSAIGIVAWWALAVGVAFKLWPATRIPRAAIVAGSALAALAILTVLSTGWAVSDEKAFLEFTRVLTYLGVLAVVAIAVRARHAAAVSDGLALGIVGVVGVALASRFWWGDIGPGAPPSFFPVQTRLHYPVNYWNGLAILAGMALPLLLRAAVAQRPGDPARAGAGSRARDRRDDLSHLLAWRGRGGGLGCARLLRAHVAPHERPGGDRNRVFGEHRRGRGAARPR